MHPQSTASYRVAFDVRAGIEPITLPASSTAAEIAEKVTSAFAAAEVPIAVNVAVDLEGDAVTVTENGDVIEHGSITRVDEQPQPEPDPREVAWQLVINGVAGGLPIPAAVNIPGHYSIFEVRLPQDDREGADAWAAYLGLDAPEMEPPLEGCKHDAYRSKTYSFPPLPGWKVEVTAYCDKPAEGGAAR